MHSEIACLFVYSMFSIVVLSYGLLATGLDELLGIGLSGNWAFWKLVCVCVSAVLNIW